MKKYLVIILIALIAVVAVGAYLFSQKDVQETSTPTSPSSISTSSSEYNPNYADAIQLKKPELCQDISYALQSGPTDSIDKVYGNQAVELCRSQAAAGYFGCRCDSDAVLNNMRKPE